MKPIHAAAAILAAAACAFGRQGLPAADAAPSPRALVDAWLKARKDDERDRARAAIDAAGSFPEKEFAALRDQLLDGLAKRGRRVGTGRETWFDEKKDGWSGLYLTSGKGAKGLVLGLHGGGAGSGDCGQAASAFSGAISSQGLRGLYPEVLRKTEYGWTDPPETERWVLDLVRAARRTWDVDPNRVYVTGHSMGGYGTWTYGAIHADLFAGAAAFAGAPTVYWKEGRKDQEAEGVIAGVLPNLRNLPIFVYQSTDDRNVPCAANQCATRELAKLHDADPGGWTHVYEEVTGRGHGFPEKGAGPGLEWATSHVRDPRPKRVVWQPSRDWKTSFYWVRWDRPWLGAVLTARVDQPNNAIDVTVRPPAGPDPLGIEAERESRIAALSFLVDDRLLDVTREITLRIDGRERARVLPETSLGLLVRTAEEREDPEYVFCREVRPETALGEGR